jgi:murein L,D-transpeptidase YcbB/YkuD
MAKMRPKELKKFAKTDTKGLPKKVKEQTAEEPKKAKGGFEFGKGVYESMDNKFKQALTEGMNISVNMNTGPDGNPTKNITVSADGDDAEALAMLLKMAGMGTSHDSAQAVDENSPDYPTNTETSDDAFQYSGGLNGPKSTGQTTVPVIASQERRLHSESVELERNLFRLYQNYKAQ